MTSSEPSSSRSLNRSSTSSGSRKGKERAQDPATRTPRPSRYAPVHSSTDLSDHQPRKRYPATPRRVSVEFAPDDSQVFAEGAQELEVRGEVELDLDEASGEPPPWGGTEESEADEEPVDRTARGRAAVLQTSPPARRSRETSLRADTSAEIRLRQKSFNQSSLRRPEVSRPSDTMKVSRNFTASRALPEQPSLPALPTPDLSQTADEEDEIDTLSSRRASLFRSTSRSSPRPSQSPSLASIRKNQELSIPPQGPIRVGMTMVSTPLRSTSDPANTTSGFTPHPPGRWHSPSQSKGNVRFSPLGLARTVEADRSLTSASGEGEVLIHRLKLSPAKERSPRKEQMQAQSGPVDGDTSFLRRLSRAVTRRPVPPRSTALRDAQSALDRASDASSAAHAKVERTRRQWLEALASVQDNPAVGVMRKSWSWGTWVWSISMELLLLWGVFR